MQEPQNSTGIQGSDLTHGGFPIDDMMVDLNEPNPTITAKPKPQKDHFWRTITIFISIVILLRLFVIDPFLVHGPSMQPTFEDGNYIIVDKLTYKLTTPKRGDVIVFDAPTEEGKYFIKRVIGLPGERVVVEGTKVTIYNNENQNGFNLNEPYVKFPSGRMSDRTLASDEYFVMGDNRDVSSDSRIWGALKAKAITGRALIRILPFGDAGIFPGEITNFQGVTYPTDTK